jgi:hypothetical protein
MRTTAILLMISLAALISCKKESTPEPVPQPVDNGPIGGNYSLAGITTRYYDTIPGSGIITINEYTTATTNLKGSLAITANSLTSKGLMVDYTLTGTKKEVNTSTGATTTTSYTPQTGSRGESNTTYSSNYTITAAAGEITVNDAQYLFSPAFLIQPSNKKHKYTLTGSTLKITSETYDASTKTRSVNEAIFTKQ